MNALLISKEMLYLTEIEKSTYLIQLFFLIKFPRKGGDLYERKYMSYVFQNKKFYTTNIHKLSVVASSKNEIARIVNAIQLIHKQIALKAILVYPRQGYGNELFPAESVWVCESGTVIKSSPTYLASLIVHESEHMRQYKGGKRRASAANERGAYEAQRRFLIQAGDTYGTEWLDTQFKSKWWIQKSSDEKKKWVRSEKYHRVFCEAHCAGKINYTK